MKTGILSGSFNPIHTGHLILASYLCEYEGLDEILFLVSPQNPLKEEHSLLDDCHRIEMVKLAIEGNRKFKYDDIETHMPKPSYTIKTLEQLRLKYPDKELYLIIGADNWLLFDKWYESERIKKDFNILIYPRLNYPVDKNLIHEQNIRLTQAPIIEISSTEIRKAFASGKNMNYFLPGEVYQYILEHNLYQKI